MAQCSPDVAPVLMAASPAANLVAAAATPDAPEVEGQAWSRCAVHAVNNIIQREGQNFTYQDFERIADSLQEPTVWTSISGTAHKSAFGIGAAAATQVISATTLAVLTPAQEITT